MVPSFITCKKKWSDLVQETNDIAGYYTKMKGLWDEHEILNVKNCFSCACTCGGKLVTSKSLQDETLTQFLMGLNDTYFPARSNILMVNPLSSVSLSYSLIVQDEKQRKMSIHSQFTCHSTYYIASNNNIAGHTKVKERKSNSVCSHCKKPGHSIDKWYIIIDFPIDFKFTRFKRLQEGIRSNVVFGYEEGDDSPHTTVDNALGINQLSKDKFFQIVQLLHQVKISQTEPTVSDVSVSSSGKNLSISCLVSIKSTH